MIEIRVNIQLKDNITMEKAQEIAEELKPGPDDLIDDLEIQSVGISVHQIHGDRR